ncbi:RNA-directed DNA polymerase from mobile element jockey-like [Brachionus plicatilis]|uniref:RNA-directed DNA polymerase from mobile element jockey-like n=1 Tax=Brachionus plicatilis TaxID=10195 RepID=A0A3M7QEG5_BRAPC|nr:RNA-directed DNA polymerase from mobile element jockey-like [Brachionus plicatilis]
MQQLHLLEANITALSSDVIGITETWFDERSVVKLLGFHSFRSDRRDKRTGGGLVTGNTFITNGQFSSLLDLVLVSDSNRVSVVDIGTPLATNALRSHCSLSFQYISEISPVRAYDSRNFNWRTGDYVSMNFHFKSQNWDSIFESEPINENYSSFLGVFGAASKLFIKRRREPQVNRKPPWWNSQIAALVRRKRRLFIGKCVNKKDDELTKKHKNVCKISIITFEYKLAKDAKENPKRLYSYINHKFSERESIAAIRDKEGELVTDKPISLRGTNSKRTYLSCYQHFSMSCSSSPRF